MLIVSDFHDYYDTALAHGIDKTCVYNRKTELIEADRSSLHCKGWCAPGESCKWGHESEFLFQCVVGFAGNLYPMIYHAFSRVAPDVSGKPTFLYDAESCMEFLDEKFPETREHDNSKKYMWHRQFDMSDVAINEFYGDKNKHKNFEKLFVEHRVPVFIARNCWKGVVVELDPRLKEYGFMKVKDPYTALQEIHMFLSGVLGGLDRDMAEVDNEHRIAQHGFDKWSFRKEPTKRKR